MTETERQLYAMGETIRQLISQHNGLLATVLALQQRNEELTLDLAFLRLATFKQTPDQPTDADIQEPPDAD